MLSIKFPFDSEPEEPFFKGQYFACLATQPLRKADEMLFKLGIYCMPEDAFSYLDERHQSKLIELLEESRRLKELSWYWYRQNIEGSSYSISA